ncbi:MAG TPA: molybdenum cofactor guanylyltransferase [Synergistaceae bacterium]|nr:molybdenum cofactor guanylyltransferase [Synergistaceae bacterium]HPJ24581.1 molybdenum cofactor guanylyltransferase [Synergistaceae bacterium]HPQ36338.1 molybdenum cofactor guanylyltransferase [Synergistaceae bacterium]
MQSEVIMFNGQTRGRGGKIPASAVILAGGRGRRMGGNKLFLTLQGELILGRILLRLAPCFEEILLSIGPEDRNPLEKLLSGGEFPFPLKIVEDRSSGKGPLEGLARSLEHLSTEWGFFVGCDMPWIQEMVVRTLWKGRQEKSQALVARLGEYLEPLHAFYSRSCLPWVEKALEEGKRQVKSFYPWIELTVVEETAFAPLPGYRRSFLGMNAPEDLRHLVDPYV